MTLVDAVRRPRPAPSSEPLLARPARLRDALPAWAPGLALALLLSLPTWGPFLRPDLDVGRLLDGDQHLAKAYSLAQLIAGGDPYPRWTPELYGGYGYPTFVFYAPATYYLLIALTLLPGVSLASAYGLTGAFAGAALVAGVYGWGWTLWRNGPAAALAAVAVATVPYAIPVNLFVRGAVPEVIGLALLAWLLCAVTAAWREGEDHRAGPPRTSLALTTGLLTGALLLTHNVSAAVGAVVVPAWLGCLTLWRPRPAVFRRLAGAAVLGALGTAFFWLPALAETGLVQVERMYRGNLHYRNWFLAWPGFHAPLWGLPERSPWTPGAPIDLHLYYRHALYGAPKLSLWQAVILCASALAGGAALLARPARRGERQLAARCALFGSALAVALYAQSFDWALPLWERFSAWRSIQAPYRLLGPAALATALAAGSVAALLRRTGRTAWAGIGVTLVALVATGTAGRSVPVAPEPGRATGVEAAIARQRAQPGTTASTDEFLPRSADFATWHEGEARGFWIYERLFPEASWLAGRLQVWSGEAAVHRISGGGLWTGARVTAGAQGARLAFHQLAFPGWRATLDGRPVSAAVAPDLPEQALRPGFLLVDVPPGEHVVTLRFGPDGPATAGGIVSAATLGAVAWATLRRRGAVLPPTRMLLAAGAVGLIAGAGALVVPRRLARYTSPATAETVVAIADAALAGGAEGASPTGGALGDDRFLDVRFLALLPADRPQRDAGPRTRRWLFAHAPSEVAVELTVPPDALFQSALALDPRAWDAPLGDGVRFLAGVTPTGGAETVVLDATVHPRGRGEQRRWLDVAADLRPWAGQRVRLSLRTENRQDASFDWSGWAEPAVVRVDRLTADRLLRSTAELQERILRP